MTLSMDLRVRIYEARQAGETTAEVAERFAVSPAFVRRLMQRHRETTTFVGGLTARGFVAPMVLDGAMTAAAFTAYVEQVLAPETRTGDVVIPDNLPSHKTAGVRAAFARCRIEYRYLPPYSPDL